VTKVEATNELVRLRGLEQRARDATTRPVEARMAREQAHIIREAFTRHGWTLAEDLSQVEKVRK
jgi:hypothetical protein